jgi:DNA modification methylase
MIPDSLRKYIYYEEPDIVLLHGDCLDMLPHFELNSIDLVLTDPPYGINACNQTLGTGKKEFHRGDWDKVKPDIAPLLTFPYQIIWGGNYFTDVLPPSNDWLIWHKKNDGLSFSEAEMAWSNIGKNVRVYSRHWGGEKKQHPTQKPEEVMNWCVSLTDAQLILDPFLGSGTTAVACKQLGRKCIGIELESKYLDIAIERLRQEVLF